MAGEEDQMSAQAASAHKLFVRAAAVKRAGCAKREQKRGLGAQDNPFPQNACPKNASGKLSEERMASSIPSAPGSLPDHQDGTSDVWMYPSEKQFYNAMKKKGWEPQAGDMGAIVAIHNTVNERAWREVQNWEMMHHLECRHPKLKQFHGRPNDYSPKARLLNFLGYKLPFDRHDWVVDRCGREIRYIVDFYNAAPLPNMPVAMHLDVRPALDSFEAIWDRLRMQFRWFRSGRWKYE